MNAGVVEVNFLICWRIPDDDVTVQLGWPAVKEQLFDGEDGQRRAREHLQMLWQAQARGMCSDITVKRRIVTVFKSGWETVQEVDE